MSNATIQERGNGFPSAGDYVPGDDGNLYLIVSTGGNICTHGPGVANDIEAVVELADWDDCDEDEEFPAMVITDDGLGSEA